jgi:exosortase H (IPTLxxWG-CTERM-specific)
MKKRRSDSRALHGSDSVCKDLERLPSGKTRFYSGASPAWSFGLRFCGLMALFYVMVLTPFCDRLFYSYLGASARIACGILNCLGQESHASEITIRSARFAIRVQRGCDAIEPSWFFCAGLISFPAPAIHKITGIVLGVLLMQLLNLVRIVSLYFIGLNHPGFFRAAHVEIWPAVFIVAVVLLWIGWIRRAKQAVRPGSHAGA